MLRIFLQSFASTGGVGSGSLTCVLTVVIAGWVGWWNTTGVAHAQFGGPPLPPVTNPPDVGAPFYPPATPPGAMNQPLPPLNQPWQIEPNPGFMSPPPFGYMPNYRDVPIDVSVSEGQTGRFSIGGSVNSDLGVAGNIILEERNFDISRFPGRFSDLSNGAFRGAGQNFRLELVPGNLVQRYSVNWSTPSLFGYSPFSLATSGYYFTRFYR
ncbi:MAG: hypothetical protein ACK53L_21555, partial [Pirellulaceae bacterium]